MAKLAFFVVVLLALAALSAATRDSTLQLRLRCQRQLQERSLDACRQVVDHQLAVQLPFFLPRSSLLRMGVRAQCCQQLLGINRECHAAAIRQIVRRYEHQAMVPLREDPYYPSPGEDEEQQGGSFYPGETYPQQEQGWEQQQGQGHQAFPPQGEPWWRQQQQGQGSYQPSETFPQQQEQGWYRPSQTYRPQQEQGWYRPSQTYRLQQEQGPYRPQQHQQGSYRPSQTYPQQQEQGLYRPSQTYPQQQEQGSYRPSQTYRPQQQQQQEGGFCGQSTAQQQHQQQQGRQEPYGFRVTIYHHARQPAQHELGRTAQQQAARLRMQLKVVARAQQVAAQLPAMCMLEGRVFSAGQH